MSTNPRIAKAIENVHRLLTEIGLAPVRDETVAGVHIDFDQGELPLSSGLAAITESEQFVFYLNLAVNVEPERRDEVARFITHANWNLLIGTFAMDYSDGHVRFKLTIDFRGGELHEYLIRNAILDGMNAVEAYSDRLLDVALRGHTAEDALRGSATERKNSWVED